MDRPMNIFDTDEKIFMANCRSCDSSYLYMGDLADRMSYGRGCMCCELGTPITTTFTLSELAISVFPNQEDEKRKIAQDAFDGSIDAAMRLMWLVFKRKLGNGSSDYIAIMRAEPELTTVKIEDGNHHTSTCVSEDGFDLLPARAWLFAIMAAVIAHRKENGGG